jgi:hypothetical protein
MSLHPKELVDFAGTILPLVVFSSPHERHACITNVPCICFRLLLAATDNNIIPKIARTITKIEKVFVSSLWYHVSNTVCKGYHYGSRPSPTSTCRRVHLWRSESVAIFVVSESIVQGSCCMNGSILINLTLDLDLLSLGYQ